MYYNATISQLSNKQKLMDSLHDELCVRLYVNVDCQWPEAMECVYLCLSWSERRFWR